MKAAGFRWAPKQELFVAPSWMPEREDLLLDLCDEIGAPWRPSRTAFRWDSRFWLGTIPRGVRDGTPSAFGTAR
jgi:hypothetical protein